MKNNFRLLFLFLIGISIFSCKDDDDEIVPQDYFEAPQPDSIIFKTAAGEETLDLKTNLFVTPEVPAEAASWCEVEFYPISPRVVIKVNENLQGEARSAKILLKAEQFQHTLYVEQLGQAPAIRLLKDTYRVGQRDTSLLIPFVTNVTTEVKSLANWITCTGITKGEKADTLRLHIPSTQEIRRTGEVELSYQDYKQVLHIIQQSDDTVYSPVSSGNLLIKVPVHQVESNLKGNELEKLYDGDFSGTWQGYLESQSINLDFYFENAEQIDQIDQIIYYPGLIPTFPLESFQIYAKCEGDAEFKPYGEVYDFEGTGKTQAINIPKGIVKPEAVRLHILTAKKMGANYFVTAGEFEFYKQKTNLSDIFTDATCSELKKGVNIEQIMAIEDDFIRNLALHLLAGTYDSEFRVQEYLPYAHPDKQKEEHISRAWGFLDNVTGIVATANEPLVIFVGDTHGEEVGVFVSDWKGDLHPHLNPVISLAEGMNIVKPSIEGLLYITYLTERPQDKQPIKIHIASGKVNGYFDLTKPGHDNAYWQQLLNTQAKYEYLDVKGKLCHLNFLTEDFKTYCPTDIERLVSVCDSVIYLEHELSGLYKYPGRMYPNRMFCRYTTEVGNFLAHASDYVTCYIGDAVKGILDARTLRTDPWAMAHELGHVHQHRNMTWVEMTEVSNNVFSLYVQTALGNTSRLCKEDRYQEAYDNLVVSGKPYNDADAAYDFYFVKLVPLWQLHLYFTKVAGNKLDFYPDLYEKMRKQGELSTDKEKFLNFMKNCCEVGKADLSEFFRFYGCLIPATTNPADGQFRALFDVSQNEVDEVTQAIQAMGYAKPPFALQYLTDENVELFRQNKAVVKGTAVLSGNILTLTDWQNVVAYEVRKAGKLIQISQKNEFTLQETGAGVTVMAIAADGTTTPVTY